MTDTELVEVQPLAGQPLPMQPIHGQSVSRVVWTPARIRISDATERIFKKHFRLAPIVASWKVHERPQMGTAATDGPNLYYDPEFIMGLTAADVYVLVLHEAAHVFLAHHLRADHAGLEKTSKKQQQMWNIAADLALNHYIETHFDPSGFLRKSCLFPGETRSYIDPTTKKRVVDDTFVRYPKGKSAEFYYQMVEEDVASGKIPTKTDPNGEPCLWDGEGEPAGQVLPHPGGKTKEGFEKAKREWEKKVGQGIKAAKSRGEEDGWLEEMQTYLYGKKSEQNWKVLLRNFFSTVIKSGLSYSRPNRRHSYRSDVIIPVKRTLQGANGYLLVDTSGSMNEAEMEAGITEISGILDAYPTISVTMGMCDTRLIEESEKVYHKGDFPLSIPVTWRGRGGTDLAEAIKQIGERDFAWLVVVSDMEWPVSSCGNPGIPVIWVNTRPSFGYGGAPTFGTAVYVTV